MGSTLAVAGNSEEREANRANAVTERRDRAACSAKGAGPWQYFLRPLFALLDGLRLHGTSTFCATRVTMPGKPLTLSKPSKMPCYSYSLPAADCITGAKLRKVDGSVCAGCYAHKGYYRYGNVQESLTRRLKAVLAGSWVNTMVDLIGKRERSGYFRWHDSGDIQSIAHLAKIAAIASALPHIKFWLPTKERGMVRDYLASLRRRHDWLPRNLTIRISAPMVGRTVRPLVGTVTSSVVRSDEQATCPATTVRKVCGDCRACWDLDTANVAYKLH